MSGYQDTMLGVDENERLAEDLRATIEENRSKLDDVEAVQWHDRSKLAYLLIRSLYEQTPPQTLKILTLTGFCINYVTGQHQGKDFIKELISHGLGCSEFRKAAMSVLQDSPFKSTEHFSINIPAVGEQNFPHLTLFYYGTIADHTPSAPAVARHMELLFSDIDNQLKEQKLVTQREREATAKRDHRIHHVRSFERALIIAVRKVAVSFATVEEVDSFLVETRQIPALVKAYLMDEENLITLKNHLDRLNVASGFLT